jgi:hypothetical protein
MHSQCRGPLAIDEDPSGSFWDTGVGAVSFHDGDHWSQDSSMEHYHWSDSESSPITSDASVSIELLEGSSQ